jgi:hypothetical protein
MDRCTSAHAQYSTAPCTPDSLPFTGTGILLVVGIISLMLIALGALMFWASRDRDIL